MILVRLLTGHSIASSVTVDADLPAMFLFQEKKKIFKLVAFLFNQAIYRCIAVGTDLLSTIGVVFILLQVQQNLLFFYIHIINRSTTH